MNLVLESDRLLLRPLEKGDLDIGIDLFTDPEVTAYIGGPITKELVAEEMLLALRRCAGGAIGVWCILDRAGGEKLGTVALLPLPIEDDDTNWDLVVGDSLPDAEITGHVIEIKAAIERIREMIQNVE